MAKLSNRSLVLLLVPSPLLRTKNHLLKLGTNDLVKIGKFVLKNNFFEFDNEIKQQIFDTAIGTKFIPLLLLLLLFYMATNYLIKKKHTHSESKNWIYFIYWKIRGAPYLVNFDRKIKSFQKFFLNVLLYLLPILILSHIFFIFIYSQPFYNFGAWWLWLLSLLSCTIIFIEKIRKASFNGKLCNWFSAALPKFGIFIWWPGRSGSNAEQINYRLY